MKDFMKSFRKIPWLKANTTPKVIILFELSDKLRQVTNWEQT